MDDARANLRRFGPQREVIIGTAGHVSRHSKPIVQRGKVWAAEMHRSEGGSTGYGSVTTRTKRSTSTCNRYTATGVGGMGRSNRALVAAALALSLAAAGMAASTAVASADEPDTQTRMRNYSEGEIWQTSATWGRVRHRPGFEWTLSEPHRVRAVAQVQVDWPTECTIGQGLTIGGCTPKLLTKVARLDFHELTILLRWSGPKGSDDYTCQFEDTGTGPESTETWTCNGQWMPLRDYVKYRASTPDLTADVKDDGEGQKYLPPLRDNIDFQP